MANSSMVGIILSGSRPSTLAADTAPAQVSGDEFEKAIRLLESEAAGFSESIIKDPSARADYIRKTKAASTEIIDLVKQRKITPHEGARVANAMRNQILELARSKLSDFGLEVSKDIKRTGPPLSFFEEIYSQKLFGRSFSSLSKAERDAVWSEIIHAAGRSNKAVNMRVKWYGVAGRTLLVVSLAFAVHNVAAAADKPRQTAKEGTTFAGGAVGGTAAGMAIAALASNPGGWVVGVVIFVGAAIGGVGSSELFDYFWPETR
jgi:hypothetical protein